MKAKADVLTMEAVAPAEAQPELAVAPVVYEVTLTVDAAIAAEFDDWLAGHVIEMVHLPGFLDADVERADAPDERHAVRVARYRVESRQALERYYADHADRMRAAGIDRFGGRFSATRRILEPAADDPSPGASISFCGNCETPLRGRYCPVCGQDSYSRVTSLRELTHNFFGDYLNFDSRLTRSLLPLIGRPGYLTNEYLGGRRARYIPPLRLYLFISVAFFFLLSLASLRPGWLNVQGAPDDSGQLQVSVDERSGELAKEPEWVQQLARKTMQAKNNPRAFTSAMIGKLPTMMFLLLPVFAFFLKALYIRSHRYYVEHLFFSFHYHAVVFLAALIYLIAYAVATRFGLQTVTDNLGVALWAYLTLYLILAMRKTYAQGWFKTLIKWSILAVGYGIAMSVALLGAVIWAAIS
ncbi:MAG TPA: DUF4286 family protein [Gammaproteobacteria bacterium]|nr:DUF4286 family protein [Gammaproteobacteria bacterium]